MEAAKKGMLYLGYFIVSVLQLGSDVFGAGLAHLVATENSCFTCLPTAFHSLLGREIKVVSGTLHHNCF